MGSWRGHTDRQESCTSCTSWLQLPGIYYQLLHVWSWQFEGRGTVCRMLSQSQNRTVGHTLDSASPPPYPSSHTHTSPTPALILALSFFFPLKSGVAVGLWRVGQQVGIFPTSCLLCADWARQLPNTPPREFIREMPFQILHTRSLEMCNVPGEGCRGWGLWPQGCRGNHNIQHSSVILEGPTVPVPPCPEGFRLHRLSWL